MRKIGLSSAAFCFMIVGMITEINATQVFNEIRISSSADDDVSNFFELAGTPADSLDGLTVLVVSAEFNPGLINSATDLTGTSVPADGFYLGSTDLTFYGAQTDVATGVDFFGSPATFLLVEGFTGAVDDDLDMDDDGTLEVMPWTSIIDSVALLDEDMNMDFPLSATVVSQPGGFTPSHVFRTPDAVGAYRVGSFADNSLDTPGFGNVPEPSSLLLFVSGMMGIATARKRAI